MRKPVIAGNWKLYKTKDEALALIEELAPLVAGVDNVEVVVAPVFTVLPSLPSALAGTSISLAAQDVFWEEEGAFTGEVSPRMLLDAGASHVIIGHSERRQYFGETDQTVNKKIKAALKGALVPIFCIGETLEAREAGDTFKVLERQVRGGLEGLTEPQFAPVIIAYEPVWAIGTGKVATDEQAQEAHAFIRGVVAKMFGQAAADKVRILYGGSVKPDNVKGLMSCTDIDGALVGGASLKGASFASIVRFGE
ncbi:triose-phosphate isomerase [Geomonas subterranea]|uniref:Triosephosphate isomerase n=1 Tax=Geomonas subterranea TaxID=2847989 RepID=A0ABX8LQL6_9BACT|nr:MULTISPECIES: triose-phosphate isomerase [Geomonas]QXE91815.1 triose-phosphate isomerase [Geomonas subterranea]QXM10092.1 triose-phosphate isomerase [Geomonas subterranea]